MFTRIRRAHYLFAASLFGLLGFHVGVWAVQLAPLSAGLHLDPAALGATVTVAAVAGLVTLFAGGRLADRFGRRPVLVAGFAGPGTAGRGRDMRTSTRSSCPGRRPRNIGQLADVV